MSGRRLLQASPGAVTVFSLLAIAWTGSSVFSNDRGDLQVGSAVAPCLSLHVSPQSDQTVDCLAPGTRLRALDADGDWLAVRLGDGRLGWVLAPCQALYSSPDPASKRLDCLGAGVALKTLSREGAWSAVRLADGRLGWVRGDRPIGPAEVGNAAGAAPRVAASEPARAAPPPPPAPRVASAPTPEVEPPPAPAAPTTPTLPAATEPAPAATAQTSASRPVSTSSRFFAVDSGESSCLNVREGPGADRGAVACLPRGAVVEVVGAEGEWLEMGLPDGRTGWSVARFLQQADVPSGAGMLAGEAAPGASPPVGRFAVAPEEASCLNVRAAASTDSRLLACLPRGAVVEAIEFDGGWLATRLPDGRTGWTIVRALTQLGESVSPVADGAGPAAVVSARPSAELARTVPAGEEQSSPPGADAAPPVQSEVSRAGGFEVSRSLDGCLNVRPAPSTRNRPLACLDPGTRVEVVDHYANWSAVRFGAGEGGWSVSEHLVRLQESEPAAVAVAEVEPSASEGEVERAQEPPAAEPATPAAPTQIAEVEAEDTAAAPRQRGRDFARPTADEMGSTRPRQRPRSRDRALPPPAAASAPTATTAPSSARSSSSTTSVSTPSAFFSSIGGFTRALTRNCLNMVNCTANDADVTVLSITPVAPNDTCTSTADTITLQIVIDIDPQGGGKKYDLGSIIALDGSDGNSGGTNNCSFEVATIGSAGSTDQESGADTCGDVNGAGGNSAQLTQTVTVPCLDSNNDGTLDDFGAVGSWSQNATDITCNGPGDLAPGTKPGAKCLTVPASSAVSVPTTTTTTTVPTTTTTTVPTTTTTTVPTTTTTTTVPTTTTTTVPTTTTTTTVPTTTTTTVPTTTTTTVPTTTTTTVPTTTTTTVPISTTTTTVPTTTTTTVPISTTTTTVPTSTTTTTVPISTTTTTVPTSTTTTTVPISTTTTTVPTSTTTTTVPISTTTTTVPTSTTTTTVPTTTTSSTTTTTTSTTTSTTTTTLPPPTGAVAASKSPNPDRVPEPGAPVVFTVRIDNLTGTTANAGGHSSRGGARAVDLTEFTLTSLVDSDFGDLNGKGDCAVPQVIPTGGFYSCSFTEVVSGTAPGTHLNKVTAKGTFPGAPPVTASAEATAVVEIVEPVPALASWGQAALLLTLAGIGIFLVSRRRVAR